LTPVCDKWTIIATVSNAVAILIQIYDEIRGMCFWITVYANNSHSRVGITEQAKFIKHCRA